MVKRTENTIQRSFSDVTAYKPSVSLRPKMNGSKCDKSSRPVFARPPSMIGDDIDILKSWAEHFVKQVHDAFSSMESLNSEDSLSDGGTDLSFKSDSTLNVNNVSSSREEAVNIMYPSKPNSSNCNGDVVKGRNSPSKCDFSNQSKLLSFS